MAQKTQVSCFVITDGKQIVGRGPEPAIALAAVVLDTAADIRMVRIGHGAVLVIPEMIGRMGMA